MPYRIIVILTALLVLAAKDNAYTAAGAPLRSGMTNHAAIADSLRNALATCSPTDSAAILSDLFDLVPKSDRNDIALQGVKVALKHQQTKVGLDLLRNLANQHIKSDSLLVSDRLLALKFPPGDDRDETVCFIDIMRNFCQSTYSTPEQRAKLIDKLVSKTEMLPATDIYGHIIDLHAICLNLSDISDSQMLTNYLNELDSLADMLRPEAYPLRNLIYVQSSLAYNNSHLTRYRSSKFDRKTLKSIDMLESGEVGMKRKYRSYNPNRYLLYTRILSTYDSLTTKETDELYAKTMRLIEIDSLVAKTNANSLRPQIYHAMKHRDYATALPLLKRAVDMPYNAPIRFYMLKMLIDAARGEGDRDALIQAMDEYIVMLEDMMKDNMKQRWRELEITYEINNIRDEFNQEKIKMNERVIKWACIVGVILVLLLILMSALFMRSRQLAKHLRHSNITFMMQRDHLNKAKDALATAKNEVLLANKTQAALISNLSDELAMPLHVISEYTDLLIDNAQIQHRPYLKRYVDMVVLNAEILTTLINDLNILFEIESGTLKLHPKRENLNKICSFAIEGVQHRLRPGVSIELEPGDPYLTVYLDVHRLMQILWQLLSNAAKFTYKGVISVSYQASPDGKTVTITVTDTGIGIPKDCSEKIFEKFVKLDKNVPGAGIGLPLARQIAQRMGASLVFDPGYTSGARFVLTLKLG